jgi:hypothetical protein
VCVRVFPANFYRRHAILVSMLAIWTRTMLPKIRSISTRSGARPFSSLKAPIKRLRNFGKTSSEYRKHMDRRMRDDGRRYFTYMYYRLTPGLFRGWAQHALLSLAKANQMTEEGARVLKYPNPYHIPRCKCAPGASLRPFMIADRIILFADSTTWETYNALSTRKQEDMVPVE